MVNGTLETLGFLLISALAGTYLRGWWRLRAAGHEPPRWRLAIYIIGVATTAFTLLGLDALADERFSMHMIQHLVLTMVAVPLVLLGNPLPLILWGLPVGARRWFAATLKPGARLRAALSTLTFMPVAGALYTLTLWTWHLPPLYDAAAEHDLIHAVEHVMLLATAILFWWPIVEPAPRLRPRVHPGLQIFYLLVATAQNTALGMALTVPERAFYPHYVKLAAALGVSAVDDQAFGGGLMWGMGHTYLVPILIVLYRLARDPEREPDRGAAV